MGSEGEPMRFGSSATLLALLLLTKPSPGELLHVPTTAYPTIQSAIDAAASGDEIVIQPGEYFEALAISERESLVIRGIDRPTVNGNTSGNALSIVNAQDIRIDGLWLTTTVRPIVVVKDSREVILSRNKIGGRGPLAEAPEGPGVATSGSHRMHIRNNRFKKILGDCLSLNAVDGDVPSERSVVAHNHFRSCAAPRTTFSYYGIHARANRSIFEENRFAFRTFPGVPPGTGDGLWLREGTRNRVRKNRLQGTRITAIRARGENRLRVDDNSIACKGISGRGIDLTNTTRSRVRRNDIEGCGIIERDSSGGHTFEDNSIAGSSRSGIASLTRDNLIRGNRVERSAGAAIVIRGRRNRVQENKTHANGQRPDLNGSDYDVLDSAKRGENEYRDNDFERRILFGFDEDE